MYQLIEYKMSHRNIKEPITCCGWFTGLTWYDFVKNENFRGWSVTNPIVLKEQIEKPD